jgi:hypothetical protein
MKPLLTITLVLLCSAANAGNCNLLCHKQVYQAAVVQQVVVPYAYYQAGSDIQADALAEKVSAKVLKLVQQQMSQQQVKQPSPSLASKSVFARCASCHSGANAAGGLVLDGQTAVSCHAYFRFGQIAGQGKNIPPKMEALIRNLTPEEKGAMNDALLDLVEQAKPASGDLE